MVSARGFTIVELILVIGIIGILTGGVIIAINVPLQLQKARDGQRKADLLKIASALELYKTDNNGYPCFPSGGCGWAAPSRSDMTPVLTQYMGSVPEDPGNPDDNCVSGKNPAYLYVISDSSGGKGIKYTLLANLENINDPDGLRPKPAPAGLPPGSSNNGVQITIGAGTCSGFTYNYWINNP